MELLLRLSLVALLGLGGADEANSYYRSDDYGRKEVVVTNEDRWAEGVRKGLYVATRLDQTS